MDEEFLRRACAILRRIHGRSSFEKVASEILQCAVQSSASDYGSFVRVDWIGRKLKIVATAGRVWTPERTELLLEVGTGITGIVADTGRTYRSDDVREDPHYVPVLDTVASELAIPVKVDGRVWGIINLDSARRAHYDGASVLRMELLAEMVASAIEFRLQTERERTLTSSLAEAEKLSTMGHLVAGIAHEVNNPLASILGCAELLAERTGDPEFEASVGVIRQQAKRAGDLVKQLLAFARMGSPESREATEVNEVVREAVELVRPLLRLSGVRLQTILDPENPVCRLNRTQIQQILVNLVTNAQQAIAEKRNGGGLILLTVATNGGNGEIRVEDNGPGMPEEVRSRIFEPFFTTKETGKGTGLGLSISRDIALFHEGDLVCTSRPGVGCEFVLSMPVHQGRPEAPVEESPSRTIDPARLEEKPNVLIVDDEAPIRWMLKRLFTPIAAELTVAECAEEAVAYAEDHHFDIVVSDFHMPGMDGIEMYHRLAGESLRRFVLITGDSSSPRVANFGEWSNVSVLEKPFELDELMQLVASRPERNGAEEPVALPG